MEPTNLGVDIERLIEELVAFVQLKLVFISQTSSISCRCSRILNGDSGPDLS